MFWKSFRKSLFSTTRPTINWICTSHTFNFIFLVTIGKCQVQFPATKRFTTKIGKYLRFPTRPQDFTNIEFPWALGHTRRTYVITVHNGFICGLIIIREIKSKVCHLSFKTNLKFLDSFWFYFRITNIS